jgi:hypothetical protein
MFQSPASWPHQSIQRSTCISYRFANQFEPKCIWLSHLVVNCKIIRAHWFSPFHLICTIVSSGVLISVSSSFATCSFSQKLEWARWDWRCSSFSFSRRYLLCVCNHDGCYLRGCMGEQLLLHLLFSWCHPKQNDAVRRDRVALIWLWWIEWCYMWRG